jgi:predicted HD superfamily hydrolase involved in NAD metabolism
MMTLYEMMMKLETMLDAAKFSHSIFTSQTAKELAGYYDIDGEKAAVAGILHDCARGMSFGDQLKLLEENGAEVDETSRACPWLLHGPAGMILAQRRFSVYDADILNAVCYHTYGRPEMGLLEMIVMISDFVEPTRNFPEIADKIAEIRKTACKDIYTAALMTLDNTLVYLFGKGFQVHANSIAARNWILLKRSGTDEGELGLDQ